MALERNRKRGDEKTKAVTLRHLSLASKEEALGNWSLILGAAIAKNSFEILSKYTLESTVCKKLPFASLPPKVGSIFLKPVKTMRSVMSIAMSTAGAGCSKNQV